MKVEIWSDYACPFCYIGKRNFEAAVMVMRTLKFLIVVLNLILLHLLKN